MKRNLVIGSLASTLLVTTFIVFTLEQPALEKFNGQQAFAEMPIISQISNKSQAINSQELNPQNSSAIIGHTNLSKSFPAIKSIKVNPFQVVLSPHISITEAYANEGYQKNGIIHEWKRIWRGDTVFEGQPLQFRMDFLKNEKIIHVYCAIDGKYIYADKCSTPFEGRIYKWILTAGIPTSDLTVGQHTFSVLIDTENGRTNKATFSFTLSREVCFDSPIVNGNCI